MTFGDFDSADQRPSTLSGAIWHALTNRRLLALYGVTFVMAVAIPVIVTLVARKWRERTMNRQRKDEKKTGGEGEVNNSSIGSFNKSILNSLRHFDIGHSAEIAERQNPIVPREEVILEEEEQKKKDEEEEPLLGKEGKKDEEGKKKKKPRKKYKDPDQETMEELKKLTEQGLHGKLATAQLRAKTQMLEEQMSDEEREKERKVRQDQLEAIFKMMETQKEKFGINDKEELAEQLKMYSV